LAVRCADHIAAAGPEAWYVATDRRSAVVVDSSVVAKAKAESESESAAAERKRGVGGLLGKARSAFDAVAELSEGLAKTGKRVAVLWECSHDQVRHRDWVKRGRSVLPYWFQHMEFVDGSVLELRLPLRYL
ncbi:MAG: hypothetical protein ABS918_10450, partial [Saccharopolyspora rectivirgula]